MRHMKETNALHEAKIGNRESVDKPTSKTSSSLVKCFICDDVISERCVSLTTGFTPHSKTRLPQKIAELLGDCFMIIINEDDFLCGKCATMINYVDKLEADLEMVKNLLTGYLKTKYNFNNSEETDSTVSDTGNAAVLNEVTETPPFDASIFLKSGDDNTQSIYSNNNIKEQEGIETEAENVENSNTEDGIQGEQIDDSVELAESTNSNKETVQFQCSECNKCFESQFEAEDHFKSHLVSSNEEKPEVEIGNVSSSNIKQTCYRCHICRFQTRNAIFLERHFLTHLMKPIYQCSLCAKRFKSRNYLLKHMGLHSIFKCKFCPKRFIKKTMLLKHVSVHEEDRFKSEQKVIELISADDTLDNQMLQSNAHSSDNVENSNMQKSDFQNSKAKVKKYDKLEELMAKLHGQDIPDSNYEGNTTISENHEPEFTMPATANNCEKAEESTVCTDNENSSELITQSNNSKICYFVVNPGILINVGNGTEESDADKAAFVKPFSDENINSLDSLYKEQQDELAAKRIFLCSVCGLKYDSDCELNEHLKTHLAPTSRIFECHVCNKKFSTEINLTRHLTKHGTSFERITCNTDSEDKMLLKQHLREIHTAVLQCFYCRQEFASNRELKQHELTHAENVTHRCSLCKKPFLTEIRLQIHMRKVHSKVTAILKCSICSKIMSSHFNLKRHLMNHEKSERNVKCNICSEVLTDKLHLRHHIENVHAEIYQCPFCQQTFTNRKMCKTHELSHPERCIYKCDSCPSSFTEKKGLEKHNSIYHRDPHCKFCGKEVTDPIKLFHHERRHEMYKNKFPCKHCPKMFQTPSGLKYHMSTHTGKYAVYCEICGRGLHSETILEEHMASHTKEPRYTCDVCGRNFSSKSTYRLHRKWHDDPLPYRCKFCGRRFKHTSIMAVHIRCVHTGERPYRCPHCPHTFSVSSTLHKHIILHTKNYPFTCKYCSKGFTARSKLSCHMAKAHGDYKMLNSKRPPCEYKMALKPSEMPSIPANNDPSVEQQSVKEEISDEKFHETVIEEQIVEASQTVFLFQEGFA